MLHNNSLFFSINEDCMFVINGILCVFHFQITIHIQLSDSVTYVVTNTTWHQIRVHGGLIYGLRISPESDGMKFSVIIQNTVRSLQGKHLKSNYSKGPYTVLQMTWLSSASRWLLGCFDWQMFECRSIWPTRFCSFNISISFKTFLTKHVMPR